MIILGTYFYEIIENYVPTYQKPKHPIIDRYIYIGTSIPIYIPHTPTFILRKTMPGNHDK